MSIDVAVITGAQQGIGAAIAAALGAAGQFCIVNYLDNADAARAVCRGIEEKGGKAEAVAADASDEAGIRRLLDAAASNGRLASLVTNAAIFPRRLLLDTTNDEWDEVMAINLRGVFLALREGARIMRDNSTGGSIVNISSMAAYRGSIRGVHYLTAKAGIIGLTRGAALELAPFRIRVNGIAPGLTDTAQPRTGYTEDELAAAAKTIPLGRLGQSEDMADAVAFLCSNAARHITGQMLHVNGGQYFS